MSFLGVCDNTPAFLPTSISESQGPAGPELVDWGMALLFFGGMREHLCRSCGRGAGARDYAADGTSQRGSAAALHPCGNAVGRERGSVRGVVGSRSSVERGGLTRPAIHPQRMEPLMDPGRYGR